MLKRSRCGFRRASRGLHILDSLGKKTLLTVIVKSYGDLGCFLLLLLSPEEVLTVFSEVSALSSPFKNRPVSPLLLIPGPGTVKRRGFIWDTVLAPFLYF